VLDGDELCQNGGTDRDAVWGSDSCGIEEPRILWGSRSSLATGIFGALVIAITKQRCILTHCLLYGHSLTWSPPRNDDIFKVIHYGAAAMRFLTTVTVVICYICSTDKPWPTRRSTVTAVARVSVTPTLIPPRNDEFSKVVLRLDVLLGVDELCQNGLTDRHAVLGSDACGYKKPRFGWDFRFPQRKGDFLDIYHPYIEVAWLAEWLACWTQAQKGPGSNRSRDAVG